MCFNKGLVLSQERKRYVKMEEMRVPVAAVQT